MTSVTREKLGASLQHKGEASLLRLEHLLEDVEPGTPVSVTANGASVEIPHSLVALLVQYASLHRRGHGATMVPLQKELTTQEAADILGVSRPYLVRLVDSEAIPHSKVGNRRRITLKDVLEYKSVRDAQRRAGLAELARLDRELGLLELDDE